MGTSGTFGGPTSSLVPSWVDEPPSSPVALPDSSQDGAGNDGTDGVDNGNGGVPPMPTAPIPYPPMPAAPARSGLGNARGDLTRGARSLDARAIRRGAARYVSAGGGGRATSRRMPNSRAVAGGVARLAHSFVSQGPAATLRRFNLDGMAGAPAEEVFVLLTDMLCPAGGTIDEAIARHAMLETVAALAAAGIGNFDELSTDDLREFFIGFVSRSIEGKILNEVGTKTLSVPDNIAGVERAHQLLRDFIEGCVRDEFEVRGTDLGALHGETINTFVDSLFESALDLVQALGEAE